MLSDFSLHLLASAYYATRMRHSTGGHGRATRADHRMGSQDQSERRAAGRVLQEPAMRDGQARRNRVGPEAPSTQAEGSAEVQRHVRPVTDNEVAIQAVCYYFALRKLGFLDKEIHFSVNIDNLAVVDLRRGRSSVSVAIAPITARGVYLDGLKLALDLYSKDLLIDFKDFYRESHVYKFHGRLLDFLVITHDFVLEPDFSIKLEAPGATGGA